MLHNLVLMAAAMVSFLVLDFLWLGGLMQGFYFQNLSPIARQSGGFFAPNWTSAIFVYVFIAAGLVFFVQPLVIGHTRFEAMFIGAAFGLILYGVYDLTNHATLVNFPLRLALTDMAWGSFACGITTVILKDLSTRLS